MTYALNTEKIIIPVDEVVYAHVYIFIQYKHRSECVNHTSSVKKLFRGMKE